MDGCITPGSQGKAHYAHASSTMSRRAHRHRCAAGQVRLGVHQGASSVRVVTAPWLCHAARSCRRAAISGTPPGRQIGNKQGKQGGATSRLLDESQAPRGTAFVHLTPPHARSCRAQPVWQQQLHGVAITESFLLKVQLCDTFVASRDDGPPFPPPPPNTWMDGWMDALQWARQVRHRAHST
jgi:hypothetical protein